MTIYTSESPPSATSEGFHDNTKNLANHSYSAIECEVPPWLANLNTSTAAAPVARLTPDLAAAHEFLKKLDPATDAFCFQTFDDCKTAGHKKRPELTRTLNGTLAQHADELIRLSAQGAGVFVTVQATDGNGRRTGNVTRKRAVFQEADTPGAKVPPLPANIEVESSPGKFHRYWLISPDTEPDADGFAGVMERMVQDWDSDPNAKDIARVLRLPGFVHQKDPAHPFMVRMTGGSGVARQWSEIVVAFPPLEVRRKSASRALKRAHQAAAAASLGGEPLTVPEIAPVGAPVDWDEVKSLLACLDPNMARTDWLKVLMALNSTGRPEAYPLALEWSRPGATFNEEDFLAAWESLTIEPDGVTLGSLYAMAQDAGWERPAPDVSGLFGPVSGSVVPPHPLAQFVTCNTQPVATRWIIPGFIGHGVVVFAGQHGVGKTTALLPLAMVAAGLHADGDLLAPQHWRHVIYITEDVEQVRRILAGIVQDGALGIDADTVADRLHIVEARRLTPGYVVQVGATYRGQFTRSVDGAEVLPLVVFDTKSAVLALEEENSNSEASAAMAALKQAFACLPVWVVGHVAKSNMTRTDVEGLSMRGGSAFEADANQVLYLVKEGEIRYLVRGKTRFEARWTELQIEAHCADVVAVNEFGSMESVTLRWGIARPATKARKEAAKQAQEREHWESALAVQREVLDAVQGACDMGNPLNREGVKSKVRRKRADVVSAIETLLNDFRLYEVDVPVDERKNRRRTAFLVHLTEAEREIVMKTGLAPVEKTEVPQTWAIWPKSSVPGNSASAPNM
jgi:hypothetical protein